MSNSGALEIPLHEAPEVHHEAPELTRTTVAESNGYFHGDTASSLSDGYIQGPTSKKPSERRKCGLSPVQLWMLALLVAFLALGAIIGGTLGGLAIQRNHSSSASPAVDNPSTGTVTTISSATPETNSTSSSSIPSSTLSHTGLTLTSSSSIPSSTRGHTGCPASNGTTYSSKYTSRFEILCNTQWSWNENVISRPPAANLEECMEQCALWNELYGHDDICEVAIYAYQDKPEGEGKHDCWLKNVSRSTTYPAYADNSVVSGALQ